MTTPEHPGSPTLLRDPLFLPSAPSTVQFPTGHLEASFYEQPSGDYNPLNGVPEAPHDKDW